MPRVLPWAIGSLCAVVATATAGTGQRASRPSGSWPVRLAWTDPVGTLAGGWRLAAEETARVLGQVGLRAESRAAPVSDPLRCDEIRVILVPGLSPRRAGRRSALAAASSTHGVAKAWVRVDAIAELLGATTPFRPLSAPPDVALRFDRLLGRVVAHEVVHLLAPGVPHGRGLTSALLDVDEFLREDLTIESGVAALVQAAARAGLAAVQARDVDPDEAFVPTGP